MVGPGGGGPQPQIPTHGSSLPLALAAVALLLIFVLVGWVLFQPTTFTQKLITFGVAAGLMVWVVSVVDGAQRRSLDRLQRRMEMQQAVAVAEAKANERGRALDAFLDSFVTNIHGSVGPHPPHVTYGSPYLMPSYMPEDPPTLPSPSGPRPDPKDD